MLEYLILNGKFQSAKHYHNNSNTTLRQQLLTHFNKGNRDQFMQIFTILHKQCKLQFYLRVYFLIYNIHPSIKNKGIILQSQKIAFKDYLDNKGAELAKTNQFLEFYALPFIKKPIQHLAFKNLFKKQWITNLKQKLQTFINEQQIILKNQIDKLFQRPVTQIPTSNGNEVKLLQEKARQMQKINKKLFQQVTEFSQKYRVLEATNKNMMDSFNSHMLQSQSKWFQLTKQLVGYSKTLIQIILIQNMTIIGDCRFIRIKKKIQKYQKFVNKKLDDLLSQSSDISIFQKQSVNDLSSSVLPYAQTNLVVNSRLHHAITNYIPTDFLKLKNILKKGTAQQKISIINGLHWRILNSKQKQIRKLNILSILYYDVLWINSPQFFQMLASRVLMKYIARFIQLISLDGYGKKILFYQNNLHQHLIGIVTQCQDPISLEYIINTLGQISSSKSFKLILIQEDIIQVCMGMLRSNKYQNNENILQNSVAILLNMVEKEQGLKKFEKEKDIFEILKRYIKNKFKITRALIYCIIYALLQSQQLFKKAHLQKLPQFFDNIQVIDPLINKVQLSYLKSKLAHFQPRQNQDNIQNQQTISQDDDDDFQIDVQQIPQSEQMNKNHLQIIQKYSLKGKQAIKQTQQLKQIYNQYKKNHIIIHKGVKKFTQSTGKQIEQITQIPQIKQSVQIQKQIKNEKKINNFLDYYQTSKNNTIKQLSNLQFTQRQQLQNRKIQKQKCNSADRVLTKNHKFQNNKIKQFKTTHSKKHQSPQHQQLQPRKKSRQEVLKQINQQIKIQQMVRQTKKKVSDNIKINPKSCHVQSNKGEQYGDIFQSRPKLRRTPPKQ